MIAGPAHYRNPRDPDGYRGALILLAAALASAAVMLNILPNAPMVDEHFHHGQILLINSDEFQRVPELTTPLGYHHSVAWLARLFNVDSVNGLRAISAFLGLSSVFLAWAYLRQNRSELPVLRSLQILLCPLLWPFYFLLYTDLASLSLVLAALSLFSAGFFWPTALVGIAMLAWRQNNIVWSGLFWLTQFQAAWPARGDAAALRPWITRSCILALPMVAFLGFLIINRGVAMGDHAMHEIGQELHPAQIWFLLLVFWLVLLPLHIGSLGESIQWLRKNPWRVLPVLAVPALVILSFDVTHPYNLALPEFHLRNGLLRLLDTDWRLLLFGSIAMTWSVLTLIVTRVRSPIGLWLYPVTVVALLPVELIEQRYYIVPIVLFLLFRKARDTRVEIALLLWFLILSSGLTAAIASTRYFL